MYDFITNSDITAIIFCIIGFLGLVYCGSSYYLLTKEYNYLQLELGIFLIDEHERNKAMGVYDNV